MEQRSPEGVLLTENQYKRFVKVRADHNSDVSAFSYRIMYNRTIRSTLCQQSSFGILQQ